MSYRQTGMGSPWDVLGDRLTFPNVPAGLFFDDDIDTIDIGEFEAATTYDPENLSSIIQSSGGRLDTSADNLIVQHAKERWWKFSVQYSRDRRKVRITENNYLLYGGIGLAAVLFVVVLGKR